MFVKRLTITCSPWGYSQKNKSDITCPLAKFSLKTQNGHKKILRKIENLAAVDKYYDLR